MLSSTRLFNRGTAFANSLMVDANDPTAPPLATRILAAVRARVEAHQKVFLAIVVAIVIATLPAARAQESDTVTLNFVNADIDAVVKAVAEITGRNFILDPRVKGTINIVSARPVPKSLVYPTLLSALRLQGFTAVESDGIVKIVPETDAKQQGGPVGGSGASGDRLITQVIPLRSESAAQLVNVLRPLISPNNTIAAFPASNALVITDYADNVRRLMRIIASLDQPPLGEPIIVPVRNASALDMVSTLNRALADTGGGQAAPTDARERVSLVAEPRSNSILVRSENPARAIRVRQLIEQLDTPQRAGGNIFIVYLKNADAMRVAETLRGLYGGTTGGDRSFPPATTATATAVPTASGVSASITSSPAATTPLATSGVAAASAPIVTGNATIQADPANNALIIMAPEPVYNNLRAIIEKLDTRRAQVFIEALIVEMTADRAGEFGIQWQVLTGLDPRRTGIQGFGGTNFGERGGGNNIIDASVNIGSLGQGLNLGLVNGTITIPGLGLITNIGLLIRALSTDANANILSTPTLLTLDNEEARVMVGSNVPFITGQYATTGSTSTVQPFQTIERHDVGLLLRVKPQITEGGTVRMVLYQEVSRVDAGTEKNATGPTLTKRSLESSVVVDDQQIIVLGGLIQDIFTDTTDKIPFAGDIPVLGQAFRYDTRTRTKSNLLIFIKPTVIRNASDGRPLTTQRYDYLRGEQADIQPRPRWFWPDTTFPELSPVPAMQGIAVPAPPGPGVVPRPTPPAK